MGLTPLADPAPCRSTVPLRLGRRSTSPFTSSTGSGVTAIAKSCEGSSRNCPGSLDGNSNVVAQAMPSGATNDELASVRDVLKIAEALQAKLAAMPERLRLPLAQHCENLRNER